MSYPKGSYIGMITKMHKANLDALSATPGDGDRPSDARNDEHAAIMMMAEMSIESQLPAGFIIAHIGAGKTHEARYGGDLSVFDADDAFDANPMMPAAVAAARAGMWQMLEELQVGMIRTQLHSFVRRIVLVSSSSTMRAVLRAFEMPDAHVPVAYVIVPSRVLAPRVAEMDAERARLCNKSRGDNLSEAMMSGHTTYPTIVDAIKGSRTRFLTWRTAQYAVVASRAALALSLMQETSTGMAFWRSTDRDAERFSIPNTADALMCIETSTTTPCEYCRRDRLRCLCDEGISSDIGYDGYSDYEDGADERVEPPCDGVEDPDAVEIDGEDE